MGKSSSNHDGFEMECEFRHETDNALLIYDFASQDEHWLPLSAVKEIHGSKTRGSNITVKMELWIARKRGFAT